jgi:hypothetical protein
MRCERVVYGIPEELTPERVRSVLEPMVHAAFFSVTPPEKYVEGWSMTIRTPRPKYLSDIAVYHERHTIFLSCWQLDARRSRRDVELLDSLAERLAETFGGQVQKAGDEERDSRRPA